jgi:hypothetical protein
MVCSTSSSSGVLQDFRRISTFKNIGSVRDPLVYCHFSQEARKHFWSRLACADFLPASEYAGGGARVGQGHSRCTRGVNGNVNCQLPFYTPNTYTRCKCARWGVSGSTSYAISSVSFVIHAECDIVRLRGRLTLCCAHLFNIISNAWRSRVVAL